MLPTPLQAEETADTGAVSEDAPELDSEVVAYFRTDGPDWQERIDDTLRCEMKGDRLSDRTRRQCYRCAIVLLCLRRRSGSRDAIALAMANWLRGLSSNGAEKLHKVCH